MSNVVWFNNKEEFDAHFKFMADNNGNEFNDDLCIEGNNNIRLGWLRKIAEQIGYENVGVSEDIDYTDTVEFDVSKNPIAYFEFYGDSISYNTGKIRIWWD